MNTTDPQPTTRPCILCGEQTTGSIGAAGLRWRTICQPCKDVEDGALAARIKHEAQVLATLDDAMLKTKGSG